MGARSVAYLAPDAFAFVRKDIEALRKEGFRVHVHLFKAGSAWRLPWALLRQFIFLWRARQLGVRQVLAHFAGHHTVLPVLLGFRTHIIIAGADACSFPGIHYGSFRKPWMRKAMAFSMRGARTLLPVHATLERFTNRFSDFGPVEQGYARFVSGLKTASLAVPYGFDTIAWRADPEPAKRAGVICVAMGAAPGNAVHYRKGIDLIIEAARALPGTPFTVVGARAPAAYANRPPNLRIMGPVDARALRDLYLEHSVYLQPSVMEGFPNALCEAMLCGCIPVVSDITSMPGIVGDDALVLRRRDAGQLIGLLRAILSRPDEELGRMRRSARERAAEFTLQRRVEALKRVLGAGE